MKKYVKLILVNAVILSILAFLPSCFNPMGFDFEHSVHISGELGVTGDIYSTDVTAAVLLLTNRSKSVNVTNVRITQPDWELEHINLLPFGTSFINKPKSLEKKAVYLPPSEHNYSIEVHYEYWDSPGGQKHRDSKTVTSPLPLPRQVVELHIFRDINRNVVISIGGGGATPHPEDTGIPIEDPLIGEGSVPAVIPPENRTRMGTFIVVNRTNSQIINNVSFSMSDLEYNIGMVNVNDRQSIALGQGTWRASVSYYLNNALNNSLSGHNVIVPSNDPQAIREHYLYFYRNSRGGFSITTDWPPVPNDVHEEDLLPPDRGFGRGLLKITNRTTAIVTSVLKKKNSHPERVPLFLNSESGGANTNNPFAPSAPIQYNETGYVDVIGTSGFPIVAESDYRVIVLMAREGGEATYTRYPVHLRDRVVEIVIDKYDFWDDSGCGCPPPPYVCNCGPPPPPPTNICTCENVNCLCGDDCKCPSEGCTCAPICPPGECTCDPCICTPGNCTCPEINLPPPQTPSTSFSIESSRNTLIDTGLALRGDRVLVWGFRGSGQQGNGTTSVAASTLPTIVNSLSNIVQVTGSAYTLVAIDRDGNAWGWGQNLYGAAGVGQATGVVNRPRQINFPGNAKVDYVAAGEYFFIARGTDGSVYTWGHNLYGQLGTGGRGNHPQPVRVDLGGRRARVVGAAYEGAFVVTICNEVFAWGDNEASGLGFPGPNYGVQSIERSPTRVPNLSSYASRIQYIAGGNGWGQALLNNGDVIGWGLRAALGEGTTSVTGSSGHTNGQVVQVTQGIKQMHSRYVGTIALTTTGEVRTWGQTGGSAFPTIYGARVTTRQPPLSGTTIVQVGGGKEHVYYLDQDGRVWGAGYGALRKLSLTTVTNRSWPGIIVNLPPNPN